jgi:uncharacterized protein YjbI with pentapeptide repeats
VIRPFAISLLVALCGACADAPAAEETPDASAVDACDDDTSPPCGTPDVPFDAPEDVDGPGADAADHGGDDGPADDADADPMGTLSVDMAVGPAWIPRAERYVRIIVERGNERVADARAADGDEVLFALPAGEYLVRTSRGGFAPKEAQIEIAPDTTTALAMSSRLRDLAAAQLNLRGVIFDRTRFEEIVAEGILMTDADMSSTVIQGDLSGVGIDLSGALFRFTQLAGADLSGLRLNRATFANAEMVNVVFIDTQLEEARITSCNLVGARFIRDDDPVPDDPCGEGEPRPGIRLRGAELQENELSGAILRGVDLTEVVFSNSILRGADLRNVCMRDTTTNGAMFQEVDLTGADLTGSDLAFVFLQDAILIDTIMVRTNLHLSGMERTDLTGADMRDITAQRVILRGAKLVDTVWDGALMTEAFLSDTDLTGAQMQGADMVQIDLERATVPQDMHDTEMPRAKLTGTDLTGRNFQNANLAGADFSAANLTGANFTGATLDNAIFSDDTICTNGRPHSDEPNCIP